MAHKTIESKGKKSEIDKRNRNSAENFRNTAIFKPCKTIADYYRRKTETKAHSDSVANGADKVEPYVSGNKKSSEGGAVENGRSEIKTGVFKFFREKFDYHKICGKIYRRKVKETGPVWICSTYNTQGKAACPSKAIPEPILEAITDKVGGIGKITVLQACDDNTLVLTLTSGEQIVKRWQDRSRRQSWTPEMKEKARQKDLERRSHYVST